MTDAPTIQTIYRDHAAELRAYASRRLHGAAAVDDVLQDAFLRMHLSLARLQRPAAARAWAFSVLRSSMVDHLRRQRSGDPLPEGLLGDEGGPQDDDRLTSNLARYVASLVQELPEAHRRAVMHIELEGLPIKRAAELEGVSETAMKSRIQRARARLAQLTDRCCRVELDARGGVLDCVPRHGLRQDWWAVRCGGEPSCSKG